MGKDSDKDYVINIENVKKAFGKNVVLKDVNLKVKEGESIVTLGKSGTGKSVILQCIAGLLKPDEGKILVYGENVPSLDDEELQTIRKKIGFLFQSGALYDSMSVRENLSFPLKRLTDLSDEEITTKVIEALKNVGLENAIDKMPSELSGGMKKRIGLARTLITDPKIMLYDEPTTGLDPSTSREISQLVLEVQKKYKTTSIIVTHDMECARMVADRIVVLKDGEYIVEGTFDELQKSDDPFVKSFFEGLNF
ncbi:MAG: ABC transporter ATP-binding protein [Ignavibacteria bacterium]|nr:ABC transporter ATP-binding protein [Ignavibacteria bacterium]